MRPYHELEDRGLQLHAHLPRCDGRRLTSWWTDSPVASEWIRPERVWARLMGRMLSTSQDSVGNFCPEIG